MLTMCESSVTTQGASLGGKMQVLVHGPFALNEAFGYLKWQVINKSCLWLRKCSRYTQSTNDIPIKVFPSYNLGRALGMAQQCLFWLLSRGQ